MTTTRRRKPALAAMYAGLGLTTAATIVPYADRATGNVLAGHIAAGYPAYAPARVDAAALTYLIYLSVVGVLGALCWLAAIRAEASGKRWARPAAATLFVTGSAIALFDLLVKDTSGDTGLPPLLGWAGILPCLAGLAAVILQWRRA